MIFDEPPWDLASIREFADLKPDMTAAEIGQHVTARFTKAQLRDFAANYIAEWIDAIRRAKVREVERHASTVVTAEELQARQDAKFEKWLADPQQHWRIANGRDRRDFKYWAGDRFDTWHKAARAAAEAASTVKPNAIHLFEGDWYPDGPAVYDRYRRQTKLAEVLKETIATYAEEIRLEVTQELLGSLFALGDGRRVTWGAATVGEHQQRIQLLLGNAAGNVEAAARHQAAITLIERAGVSCLGEVAELDSAAAA